MRFDTKRLVLAVLAVPIVWLAASRLQASLGGHYFSWLGLLAAALMVRLKLPVLAHAWAGAAFGAALVLTPPDLGLLTWLTFWIAVFYSSWAYYQKQVWLLAVSAVSEAVSVACAVLSVNGTLAMVGLGLIGTASSYLVVARYFELPEVAHRLDYTTGSRLFYWLGLALCGIGSLIVLIAFDWQIVLLALVFLILTATWWRWTSFSPN